MRPIVVSEKLRSFLLTLCLIIGVPTFLLACLISANLQDVHRLEERAFWACATSTPRPSPTPQPLPPPVLNFTEVSQAGWSLLYTDSSQPGTNNEPENAFDGNDDTFWHTRFLGFSPAHPHEIQISLGGTYTVTHFQYTPKQLDPNGRIASYDFYTSEDNGDSWDLAASGVWGDSDNDKIVEIGGSQISAIRLVANSEISGDPWTAVGEIRLFEGEPGPPAAPLIPTAAPIPTETPYYRVGEFYLNQTARFGDAGIRLVDYDSVMHPEAFRGRVHFVTFEIENYGSSAFLLPVSQLVFISEVRGSGDFTRGNWNHRSSLLEIRALPEIHELEESSIAPGEIRRQTLAILTPDGTVGEIGLTSDWRRPVEFGSPIWFYVDTDLIPCVHGESQNAPTPTSPFADEITPVPINNGIPISNTGSGIAIPPTTGRDDLVGQQYGCRQTVTGLLHPDRCGPNEEFHSGIDIANTKGWPVWAPITGTITFVGAATSGPDCSSIAGSDPPHISFGNYIVIEGYGQQHLIAHLQSFIAEEGDVVNQGENIAYLGSTGCSTGGHVHWECRENYIIVDPRTC